MMFTRGSAVLTTFYQRLLTELVPVFNRIDNKIMISVHTDAAQYSGNAEYNNWNLSGERAIAERSALDRG
ncbi:OmpA family protein, partial [Pantoea dispersa]|uniref:OmpA family protein n=1 Tax=Pantoea dispersa TaxID=59814 RepID=UPI0021AFF395|nr:OmpA family protein [Pantoea dispersa]